MSTRFTTAQSVANVKPADAENKTAGERGCCRIQTPEGEDCTNDLTFEECSQRADDIGGTSFTFHPGENCK